MVSIHIDWSISFPMIDFHRLRTPGLSILSLVTIDSKCLYAVYGVLFQGTELSVMSIVSIQYDFYWALLQGTVLPIVTIVSLVAMLSIVSIVSVDIIFMCWCTESEPKTSMISVDHSDQSLTFRKINKKQNPTLKWGYPAVGRRLIQQIEQFQLFDN